MDNTAAKVKTCPFMSGYIVPALNQRDAHPEFYTATCLAEKCSCWESEEPESTEGNLFGNGHCGLIYNPSNHAILTILLIQ